MDRKTLLAVVLIMAVLMVDQVLWSRWTKPKRPETPADTTTVATRPGAGDSLASAAGGRGSAVPLPTPGEASSAAALVGAPTMAGEAILSARVAPAPVTLDSLQTPYFTAIFTSQGGAVRSWEVTGYRNPRLNNAPVNLIPEGQTALHVVAGVTGASYDFSRASFRRVGGSATEGWLSFAAQDSSGIRVTKTYRVARDPSLLDLEVRVSAPPQLGPLRYRFGWANPLPLTEINARPMELTSTAYLGAKLETVDAGKIAKEGVKRLEGNVRWAGQRSKYFIAAVIPDSATVPEVLFQPGVEKLPLVWLSGAAPPGTDVVRHARLYAGPIQYETLVRIGAGLEDVANLGWKWIVPVSALLLKSLELLYKIIPNYGVAIIILSLLTKIIFYPLTQSSLRTMKVMHRLQPEVNEIRERHAKDPAKMNEAMMKLYREHKVNPVGGCLPMLLQLPVFLALYQVLLHAIELRSAGFMGYIKDLSAPDVLTYMGSFPIHLLPLVMTGSTFLLQMQTPVDPRQQFMMYLMPVLMLYIMYNLPSGVILYWTVNNLVSALQQYLVNVAEDRRMGVRT